MDERAQADHSMELPDRRELGRGESRLRTPAGQERAGQSYWTQSRLSCWKGESWQAGRESAGRGLAGLERKEKSRTAKWKYVLLD